MIQKKVTMMPVAKRQEPLKKTVKNLSKNGLRIWKHFL
jgi:hypothetical protein